MQFSEDIVKLLEERFPGKNIYQMSLEELKAFREEVTILREEYFLLEMGTKTLANAAYGAAANQYFYFYNVSLAADITGEGKISSLDMLRLIQYLQGNYDIAVRG